MKKLRTISSDFYGDTLTIIYDDENIVTRVLRKLAYNGVLNIKFLHLIIASLIAITIPALWGALEWSFYQLHLYQSEGRTYVQYLDLLRDRFGVIYTLGLFLAWVFGLPTFYILRKHVPFKLWIVCLISTLIAILPNILIEFSSLATDSNNFSYKLGNCTVIENAHRTLCG